MGTGHPKGGQPGDPPRTEIDFEIVERPERLAALEPEWRALYARLPSPSYALSFDWIWTGWECIARPRGRRLFIVVGRQDGRPVLIWPLVVHRRGPVHQAQWLGSETSEYRDVLVEPGPAAAAWLDAAWALVRAQSGADILYAHYVRDDAALAPLLARQKEARREPESAPFVAWARWPDWQSYADTIPSKTRRDQRRRRRRLAERGESILSVSRSAERTRAVVRWTIDRKIDWFHRQGIAVHWFEAADHLAFLERIAARAEKSGTLFLGTLDLDGVPIAAEFGFVCGGRLESWLGAFDPAWAALSPGRLLQEDVLQWSFEQGHQVLDLRPSGKFEYKRLWAPEEMPVASYVVPFSAAGRLYARWLDSTVRERLKTAYHALRRMSRERRPGASK